MKDTTIALIGCGKMGSAIALGLLQRHPALSLVLYDPHHPATRTLIESALERGASPDTITVAENPEAAAHKANAVIVAVKPHVVASVLTPLAALPEPTLMISVAAGIERDTLRAHAGHHVVVRAMPNTPSLVAEGATVLHDPGDLSDAHRTLASAIFEPLGLVEWTPREALMHVATALSGSGPAFAAIITEALADGAVAMGMPREMAYRLARQTLRGTTRLLEIQTPAQLKDGVGSPGGTTMAGIYAAERAGLRFALMDAIRAATERGQAIAAEASGKSSTK